MSISEGILPEFDHEMANTRRTLERIPDEKFDWKPHERSMTMAELAGHLGNLPVWTVTTLKEDGFDVATMDPIEPPKNREDLLRMFDENVALAREAIAETPDAAYMDTWTLRTGDQVHFSMPKIAVFRGFIMSHGIHHRGQLSVYLRLNDLPVPSLYGPSADEEGPS